MKNTDIKKIKRSLNLYGGKLVTGATNVTKGSSKTVFANIPQTVIYVVIYLFCCVSSLMFSVLFWNNNVVIDKDSFIGVNIDLLLSDINGLVLTIMIVAMELYKINDSFTILRLRKNNETYKSTRVLGRTFLIMSVIASISFLVINKEGVKDTTPIESMVNTVFTLFSEFNLKVFTVIILSSVYSILVEVGILVIPSRLKVIWLGDRVVSGVNKSMSFKNRVKKCIRKGKELINNKEKMKVNNDADVLKDEKINKPISADKTSDLDINNSISDDGKVISLNKKVKRTNEEVKEKKQKSNIDIGVINKVVCYLDKIKENEGKDKIKVNVEDLKFNCGIDHNKWNKIRNKLNDEGYVDITKRLTYYTGRGKKVKNY